MHGHGHLPRWHQLKHQFFKTVKRPPRGFVQIIMFEPGVHLHQRKFIGFQQRLHPAAESERRERKSPTLSKLTHQSKICLGERAVQHVLGCGAFTSLDFLQDPKQVTEKNVRQGTSLTIVKSDPWHFRRNSFVEYAPLFLALEKTITRIQTRGDFVQCFTRKPSPAMQTAGNRQSRKFHSYSRHDHQINLSCRK